MSIEIVDPWSQEFVSLLIKEFKDDWRWLLDRRAERKASVRGEIAEIMDMPVAPAVVNPFWSCVRLQSDLIDRRVEITGPGVDPKMVINAANSGACGYMVDAEDSMCPTWKNVIATQRNLWGLVRRNLRVEVGDKVYSLKDKLPTLHFRPRGLHLVERNWKAGEEVPACLVDAGLFVYHNARQLIVDRGGVYLYLPKLETEFEARFWLRFADWVEKQMNLPVGKIKFTVLVETLPGLLRLESIMWTLRERLAGLNVGRWDYMFSMIKCLPADSEVVYPDRKWLTMDTLAMNEYAKWVIELAHRRGCHAIGGMAAQVPSRKNAELANEAMVAVRLDKEREVALGHDGTWVAHPDLVPVAMSVFVEKLNGAVEQRYVRPGVKALNIDNLFAEIPGSVSAAGVREVARSAILYMDAWLGGNGCVAIDGKMEDAATAEISRMLLWHWVDRSVIGLNQAREILRGEWATLVDAGASPRKETLTLLQDSLKTKFEFITLPAYDIIENK